MDHKSSAAILATKRSAGVAPEVNLRNPLRARDKSRKLGIHPGFETRKDITRLPKQGYQWPHKKGYVFHFFSRKHTCLRSGGDDVSQP